VGGVVLAADIYLLSSQGTARPVDSTARRLAAIAGA
jgi:hypothetical protein